MPISEIIAKEATKEIAKSIESLMDPPTKEIGNYIADKIRFLRYRSLLEIVQKAEKQAKAKGLALKMPPIKFFVPFCEAASLETADEDSDIRDIWANLLVGSIDRNDAESLLYLSILQKIGRREINFLKELVEGGRANTFARMLSSHHYSEADFFDVRGVRTLIEALPDDFDLSYVPDLIVDCGECPGVLLDEVVLMGGSGENFGQIAANFDNDLTDERQIPGGILASLGLVELIKFKDIPIQRFDPTYDITILGYRSTLIGARFYNACTGRKYKKVFFQ